MKYNDCSQYEHPYPVMSEEKIADNKKKRKAAQGSQPNVHFIFWLF